MACASNSATGVNNTSTHELLHGVHHVPIRLADQAACDGALLHVGWEQALAGSRVTGFQVIDDGGRLVQREALIDDARHLVARIDGEELRLFQVARIEGHELDL